MENLYQNEKGRRLDMDVKITRQRVEIEETKKHRDELYYELKDLKEHILRLKIIVSMEVCLSAVCYEIV